MKVDEQTHCQHGHFVAFCHAAAHKSVTRMVRRSYHAVAVGALATYTGIEMDTAHSSSLFDMSRSSQGTSCAGCWVGWGSRRSQTRV